MYVVSVILTGETFALVMFVSVCGYEYLLGCYANIFDSGLH